ncbi:MAG TPA: CsgG/HfaB family protein [Gemmatimonadaceae bacterium]|jgi:TolB-like protein
MKLHRYLTAAAGVAFAASSAFAQSKPTVAIMYFNDGAIGKANEELKPLSKGICDMLISEMSDNPAIKVIERDQLQSVLGEQKLAADGTADKATAIKVGKLLSAHHMIFGGFVTDPAGTMVLNLRSVNVETGEIEFTTNASDKTANLLALIHKVAMKTNAGLKLPDIPKQVGEARQAKDEKVPFQAVMLYSRGLQAKDAGDTKGAIQLFDQALAAFPGYDAPAKEKQKLGTK